jgi:protein-S-isoprenylcysteine O-methyltransferase Ste14
MWATPTMTIAHLFFAVIASLYILVAIQFEERDLKDAHPEYESYKQSVPMLIPAIGRLFRKPVAPAAS